MRSMNLRNEFLSAWNNFQNDNSIVVSAFSPKEFVFNVIAAAQVFKRKKKYQIQTVYGAETLTDCSISAMMRNEPFFMTK